MYPFVMKSPLALHKNAVLICMFGFIFMLMGCTMPSTDGTPPVSIRGLGTMTVLPFDGYNGEQFSNMVAQELMKRGARLVDRARLDAVLIEQGLNVKNIAKGGIDIQKIGGLLGVDVIVTGSVSPIIVYASGAPSGKVSTAALKLTAVKTGEIIASASYSANTELLAGSVLYPKAAERLVLQISEK